MDAEIKKQADALLDRYVNNPGENLHALEVQLATLLFEHAGIAPELAKQYAVECADKSEKLFPQIGDFVFDGSKIH